MSHFSKIKTNISNGDILIKTLNQMGFNFECFCDGDTDFNNLINNIVVYDSNRCKSQLLSFIWNGNDYSLVVDLQLWNLNTSFEYFMDILSQKYAYNIILDQSFTSGFSKVNEKILADGSIKLTLKRWSNSNFY